MNRPGARLQRRGESVKRAKGRQTPGPKARKAPKPSTAYLQGQVAALTRELEEARKLQTSTSKVLQIISSSRGELAPVFQAMLNNATRICEAKFGMLWLSEGDGFRPVATHGVPAALAEERNYEGVIRFSPDVPLGRLMLSKRPIHVADIRDEPGYVKGFRPFVRLADVGGARTLLVVPMLMDNELVGAISIYRQNVRPFADQQIELVKNFAAQGVIAIENARLLNELRESLQQQTATADVLKVISSSAGELHPVFEAMLEKAVRICGAKFGNLLIYDGNGFQVPAMYGAPREYAQLRQRLPVIQPGPKNPLGRVIKTKQLQHIADITKEAAFIEREPAFVGLAETAGARTILIVPMIKESDLVGTVSIYRQEVRPFTAKQIELVKNFAAQAVIAIENARLLNELRQRTDDLTESLEQQTATSEVLKIIASSPGNLEPVFRKMLGSATRICEAKFGTLFLYDGNTFRVAAGVGTPPELAEFERLRGPFRPELGSRLERIVGTKQVIHIVDDAAEGVPSPPTRLAGARSIVAVPMVKDDGLIGAITIYRQEVRPFTDKQIALLVNFAAQAVIAIENTRLLNDLNKLNQQLEQRVSDQVSEIERMGRLRRFLPPQVADLIVASGAERQLESHRREITALFCDLRGFTGFSESSDPEDVMALLRDYHEAIGGIINKYRGTLERYAGDGVMVVFNDPIPVDNPALQAVLMAIDMRAAIGELIEKWRKLGHDIGFGIGIAHGFATLGTIGFEGRFDYAAIGTVSNVASRLCDEAKPGQILISPRVLMAVEKDITIEPVGDFALKGIRRPLTAYNVLAAKAAI